MAKYVLSDGAARKLQEMMRGHMKSGRIDGDAAHMVDDGGFEHPYKLTYAASAGAVDEQTGEAAGAWIIWLPDGCLVVDGVSVDPTANLTPASNYPTGCYDLTDLLEGLSSGATGFSLYIDVDSAEFKLAESDCSAPVLIASVSGISSGNKNVLQVVRSSIVIGDGLHPWKIKIFDVNGTKHVGVWIPSTSAIVIAKVKAQDGVNWLSGVDKVEGGGAMSGITVLSAGTGGVWADAGTPTPDSQTGKVSTGVWGSWNISLGAVSCQLHTGSYVLGGDISTFYIGSVISDVCVNTLASQLFMQVSRLGSDDSDDDFDGQGGSGGGGIFAWSSGTIGVGGVFVGRKFYAIASSTGNSGTALYSVKVTFGSGGSITAAVVSNLTDANATLGKAPTDTVCYIPIYEVSNGEIVNDYRGAFVVPCWE